MQLKFLAGLALAGLVAAKDPVSSMFVYGADEQPLVASIIGNVSPRFSPQLPRSAPTDRDCCLRQQLRRSFDSRGQRFAFAFFFFPFVDLMRACRMLPSQVITSIVALVQIKTTAGWAPE